MTPGLEFPHAPRTPNTYHHDQCHDQALPNTYFKSQAEMRGMRDVHMCGLLSQLSRPIYIIAVLAISKIIAHNEELTKLVEHTLE